MVIISQSPPFQLAEDITSQFLIFVNAVVSIQSKSFKHGFDKTIDFKLALPSEAVRLR